MIFRNGGMIDAKEIIHQSSNQPSQCCTFEYEYVLYIEPGDPDRLSQCSELDIATSRLVETIETETILSKTLFMANRNNKMMVTMAAVLFAVGRQATHAFHTANSRTGLVGRSFSRAGTCVTGTSFGESQTNNKYFTRLFSSSTNEQLSGEQKSVLESKIKDTGDKIRALKDEGADKAAIAPIVQELLALKAELDPTFNKKPKKQQQKQKQQPKQKQQQKQKQKQSSADDDSSDFITARAVDYSKWYNDVIRVTGLAETSPVRGCMVIKPWGMALWDNIRTELDGRIKEHGAENAYFPLLIPKSFLSKEAEHVDGFAKECAVVTHHRLKSSDEEDGGLVVDPEAELEDPLIIRPTSETMIWYMFRKWINSHRYVFKNQYKDKKNYKIPVIFLPSFCLIFGNI